MRRPAIAARSRRGGHPAHPESDWPGDQAALIHLRPDSGQLALELDSSGQFPPPSLPPRQTTRSRRSPGTPPGSGAPRAPTAPAQARRTEIRDRDSRPRHDGAREASSGQRARRRIARQRGPPPVRSSPCRSTRPPRLRPAAAPAAPRRRTGAGRTSAGPGRRSPGRPNAMATPSRGPGRGGTRLAGAPGHARSAPALASVASTRSKCAARSTAAWPLPVPASQASLRAAQSEARYSMSPGG